MNALRFALSVLAFVAVWAVVAALAQSVYLPAPLAVSAFIVDDLVHGDMLFNIGMTLWRAAASFFFELLVLGTRDCVKLSQVAPYDNIEIASVQVEQGSMRLSVQ